MTPSLDRLFETGVLIRPADSRPNLVHLIRALAIRTGVPDIPHSPALDAVLDHIPPADHLVFVLCDGLGMNLIDRLPESSFLRSHLRLTLTATCPSTTACALTSVATAAYPNRHAVCGWFTYLPEFSLTASVLPFIERFSGQFLGDRGIKAEHVLPCPPILPRMTHHPFTITPHNITASVYNTYVRGGTQGLGYKTIANAFDEVIVHVKSASAPTYTHLYLPEVDSLCHKIGAENPNVMPLVQSIDEHLARLHEHRGQRARIVVSADHGLIDVDRDNQTLLFAGDPLLDLLLVPPTGDARMPIFHVKPDHHDRFVTAFDDRFADRMLLLPTSTIESLEILGPAPLSDAARRRFGDYIAIPFTPATLSYHPPNKPLGDLFIGVHAGLSPQEMWIPLTVA